MAPPPPQGSPLVSQGLCVGEHWLASATEASSAASGSDKPFPF